MVTHAGVIAEIAIGSVGNRSEFLGSLANLARTAELTHEEFLQFVESNRLWGRGLSVIDIHLLGAARLSEATLWTRDRRLNAAADDLAIPRVRDARGRS